LRIIIFDGKGWLKLTLPIDDNVNIKKLRDRYGKYADVLIETIKILLKYKLESITIVVDEKEFFITYE